MKQRDKMRDLFARYGDRESALIREYAAAERRGVSPFHSEWTKERK